MVSSENQELPAWLIDMLNAEFKTGKGKNPNFKGYFCVSCGGKSLTQKEFEDDHKGHRILKALSCSRDYGYQIDYVNDISDLLDVSGVAKYGTGTQHVFFPKSRIKMERVYCKDDQCVSCGADLSTTAKPGIDKFCSILCKLKSCSLLERNNQVCVPVVDKQSSDFDGQKSRSSLKLKIKIKIKKDVSCEKNSSCESVKKGKVELSKEEEIKMKNKRKFIEYMNEHERDLEELKRMNKEEMYAKSKLWENSISAKVVVDDGKNVLSEGLSFRKKSRKSVPHRAFLY